MTTFCGKLIEWARKNNSIISYVQLNDHLPDTIDSQGEIDNIVEVLIQNDVSLFEVMPSYVEQEEILRGKIEKQIEGIVLGDLKDREKFYRVSRYYSAHGNRTSDFLLCSETKQKERLEELGGILSDIYSCLK
jgi:hypothetical protein